MTKESNGSVSTIKTKADHEPRASSSHSSGHSAGIAIREAIGEGLRRLKEYQPDAERGEVSGVHRMRTTARRLRSALRAFRPMVDESWAEGLRGELKWLAGALGAVRDLDVQRDRLQGSAGDLRDELTPLFASLEARHRSAALALGDALRSTRFADLLRRLEEAAEGPVMTGPAEEPSRSVLPPLVAELWKKLKKAGRALGPGIPDEEYHEVRILAKRARYVAESVATALDALGKDAGRFARRAADVQDVLGEHHDALIARGMLESAASERPQDGPFGLAAGRMIERQAFAAEQARARFRDAWDRLDRKKMRRWMKSSGG